MNNTIKQDDLIIKKLGLNTIDRLICHTDKGVLTLKIRKGDNKYHLCLDAVPLDALLNKELMELLFPVKELVVPQVNKELKLPTELLHNLNGKTEISTPKEVLKIVKKLPKKGKK